MRLTMRISGAGGNGLTRFPALPDDMAALCRADGRLDFAAASAALGRDPKFILFSAKDDISTVALTVEFLRQLRLVVDHLTADADRDLRSHAETVQDRQSQKRMDRGQYCYVRIDVNRRSADTLVRIGVANPKEVVGVAPRHAYDIAVMCARIWQYMAEQMPAPKYVPITLVGGPGAERVFADATAMGEYDTAMKRWTDCPRRCNGIYCSPSDFTCPHYRNGRCIRPTNPLA